MELKNKIEFYTEAEFIEFMEEIFRENIARTDERLDVLLSHFEKVTEYPEGTDIIYYATSDSECSPEAITKKIKEWRAKNGKPGFRK
ncbi:Colicin-E7 immunity protein [Photorhabdus australis subsp. thailandensis]|uniref:Colicin-E7 immunity protein n=1 Tax=Photorhabdus australis subsp. thailandensis TaxID=2805096 RepID=A0A1C0U5B6_9GAMM|nr:bacteriocin immunity protein [Photorhabdus australis]OCQ53118.1 Colicin-E7 immunity protein [Photorhabdus australis subsp. thailandensis]